ncbi:MAG: sulfotransferase [Leptospirillia bacterium]
MSAKDMQQQLETALRKRAAGDLEGASILLGQLLEKMPEHPHLAFLMGTVRFEQGQLDAARELLEKAVAGAPKVVDCHYMLAMTLLNQEQLDAAEERLRKVLRLQPAHLGALVNLGILERRKSRLESAVALLQRALSAAPGEAGIQYELGLAYETMGEIESALRCYDSVLEQNPAHPEVHGRLSHLYEQRHRMEQAEYHARKQVEITPGNVAAHTLLGKITGESGRYRDALSIFTTAHALDPSNPQAVAGKAQALERLGDVEAAYELVAPQIETGAITPAVALIFSGVSKKLGREAEALEMIERLLADADDLEVEACRQLNNMAGDLLHRIGEYDKAFAHYKACNDMAGERLDPAAHTAMVDRIIAAFSREAIKRLPKPAHRFRQPVFIVGMPRSGTSLTEQIIASHPLADGAGELFAISHIVARMPRETGSKQAFPECISDLTRSEGDQLAAVYVNILKSHGAEGAERITDKMPFNFRHLGLIAALFPDVPIIHTRRDPIDTCLSCYQQMFAGGMSFSHDLGHLGFYYREYERLMAHWREVLEVPLLEVQYESLVSDQEAISRKMIEHVGLPWDDACLNFHESGRSVGTASYDQVRQPIYQTSVARWKHYEKHLGPLIDALKP